MDKQDQLAAVIHSLTKHRLAMPADRLASEIVAAVRSFMGSDEVVERACVAAAKAECADYVWPGDFSPTEREAGRKAMRAALSAAVGEDIGGGRG